MVVEEPPRPWIFSRRPRVWTVIKTVLGTALTIIGLGGLADDLATWQRWLTNAAEFIAGALAGDPGRWLFVVAGILLILQAQGVLGWAAAKFRREPRPAANVDVEPRVSLTEAQAAWSAQHERMSAELADLGNRLAAVNADLALERRAHKQTKLEWAERDLQESASMKWPTGETPSVTVRFVGYGEDHDLAQRAREVFQRLTGWPVTLDGSNNPTLPKASEFKVVFVAGPTTSFKRVAAAVSRGQLLGEGVPTGGREFDDSVPFHRLEVHVLPST